MASRVDYAPEAASDLAALFDMIAEEGGPVRADAHLRRIERRRAVLVPFPMAGRDLADRAPGLRVLAFERRVVIAYLVEPDGVLIQRVLYGGRNLGGLASPE